MLALARSAGRPAGRVTAMLRDRVTLIVIALEAIIVAM
jgi:hypothetical protein